MKRIEPHLRSESKSIVHQHSTLKPINHLSQTQTQTQSESNDPYEETKKSHCLIKVSLLVSFNDYSN